MEKEIIKEYTKGDMTIIWKPKTCIHSGVCVQQLPEVYQPGERPWIKHQNASKKQLMLQISACPTGALSYRIKGKSEEIKINKDMTTVKIKPNGPLLVDGQITIIDADGNEDIKEKTTAFCRCGASNNKPFCDGTHNKVGWKDS